MPFKLRVKCIQYDVNIVKEWLLHICLQQSPFFVI